MIDDAAKIVINRCQSTLCRRVVVLIPGHQDMIDVLETGSETCEHVFDPSWVVTIRRDVLILHALWTAGRHAATVGIDLQAHLLADRLGFRAGDAIPVTEIPLQLVRVDGRELTWQGMCVAARVARQLAESPSHQRGTRPDVWPEIADYLGRWQHYVL